MDTKWGKLNATFTEGTDTKNLNKLKRKWEVMTENSKNIFLKKMHGKI